MNRKLAAFLWLTLIATTTLAQNPDGKPGNIGEKVSSVRDARKILAVALADTFARQTETLQPTLGAARSSNSFKIISAGVPNPFGMQSNTEQKAQSQKALDVTNFDNAQSYATFLKNQEISYQGRLDEIKTDSIPDVFQYQLRSDIYWRLGMLKSAETLNDIGGNVNLTWTTDANQQRILAYPVSTLQNNPRYGSVDNYSEGFARIKKNQVFGYLSISGIESIICQYEQAEPFNQGRALVKKFEWFFIDFSGNESEALTEIESASPLKWGFSIAKYKQAPPAQPTAKKLAISTAKFAIIDNQFDKTRQPISEFYDEITPFFKSSDLYLVRIGKKYGLIRIDGKVRSDVVFDRVEVAGIAGLARVEVDKKFGLIDSTGSVKLPAIYDEVGSFNASGVAIVKNKEDIFILQLNNFKLSKPYQSIRPFDEQGYAIIQDKNKRFGLVDKAFQEVIAPVFVSLGAFNKYNLAPACREEGQCGFIRRDGSEAIPTKYREVDSFNSFGFVVVRQPNPTCSGISKSDKCLLDIVVDLNGQIILQPDKSFPDGYRYQLTDTLMSNFLLVKTLVTNESEGVRRSFFHLISRSTNKAITQMGYQSVRGYDRLYRFVVRRDDKWGLIDTTGNIIVKCIYKELLSPREGYYAVKYDNNKYGFIDGQGKLVISYEYDEVKAFNNGLAIVSKGENKMGIINPFNAKIAPCVFKNIEYLDTEHLELTEPNGAKYLLNIKGECQSNCPQFEEILRKANQ